MGNTLNRKDSHSLLIGWSEYQHTLRLAVVVCSTMLLVWILYEGGIRLEARAEVVAWLSRFVRGHVPLAWDRVSLQPGWFARGVATSALVCVAVWMLVRRRSHVFTEFFKASTHPVNLAVFRIALCFWIFNHVGASRVVWFSQMPEALRVPVWGSGWLMELVPINEAWAKTACLALRVVSFTAMIGLFARSSALLTALLAMYVLGIPQWFGKVHHYNHLVWFAALLAASPCGDALSCDAVVGAWRRARHGRTAPQEPSRVYALPLRFVWLLMGLIYFFPGFWKWCPSGLEWAWSDNLKYWMYFKWAETGDWRPVWRIDQHPWVYRLGGVWVLLFELGFIWCLFFSRLRALAVSMGLLFHQTTILFFNIAFNHLVICYTAFFDWAGLCHRVGRWVCKEDLVIAYPGHCGRTRGVIAMLRTFDLLGRVTYLERAEAAAWPGGERGRTARDHAHPALQAIKGPHRWDGGAAYRALAWRLPILWPVIPLLYVWPGTALGRAWCRHGMASCGGGALGRPPLPNPARCEGRPPVPSRAVVIVGVLLLAGNLYCGLRRRQLAWPLSCYPTFSGSAPLGISTLKVATVDMAGSVRVIDGRPLARRASPIRWQSLLRWILSTDDEELRRSRLEALWRVWVRDDPRLQRAQVVRFYQVTRSTIPELSMGPMREEALWELRLNTSVR